MRQVTGYCGFCGVHCPTVTTVDGHRVISVEPDRSHPFGGAICAKGRAAPEFHEHAHRVDFPMRRTRPKTDPDPGWERCSWDEALDLIARKLLEVRASSGAAGGRVQQGDDRRHRPHGHRAVAAPAAPPVRHAEPRRHHPPLPVAARHRGRALHVRHAVAADARRPAQPAASCSGAPARPGTSSRSASTSPPRRRAARRCWWSTRGAWGSRTRPTCGSRCAPAPTARSRSA